MAKKIAKQEKFTIRTALVLFLVAVIAIFITMIVYESTKTISIYQNYAEVKILNWSGLGFKADTDAFYFGSMPPGSGSTRKIQLDNTADRKVRVVFTWTGNISPLMGVEANNFFLEPYESRNITIGCAAPSDLPYGVYNGTFKATFYRR